MLANSGNFFLTQNDVWHSDLSCMEFPPSASFLYALKVPHRWCKYYQNLIILIIFALKVPHRWGKYYQNFRI